MNYKLIAYSQDFISFLFQHLGKDADKINQVVLFGSVARGEATKESDIDLFIDVSDKNLEDKINKIKEDFYKSIKVKKYWDLLGIENEINCSIGILKEWDSLKRSLIADGILLFGKYKGRIEAQPYNLFIIAPGKIRNKNISVWRKLYGYIQKIGKKVYTKKGLIKDYNGNKLANGVFIIPVEHSQKIISFLKKNNFKHKIIHIWQEKSQ